MRIVEFESTQLELGGEKVDAEVELWDCSGDQNFENCWPAIRYQANGIIFVCNPHLNRGQDLLVWFSEFAAKVGMDRKHMIVLVHRTNILADDPAINEFLLPAEMTGITICRSNIDDEGEELRHEFNNFLCNIISYVHEKKA